jgi:hypothetical protein
LHYQLSTIPLREEEEAAEEVEEKRSGFIRNFIAVNTVAHRGLGASNSVV